MSNTGNRQLRLTRPTMLRLAKLSLLLACVIATAVLAPEAIQDLRHLDEDARWVLVAFTIQVAALAMAAVILFKAGRTLWRSSHRKAAR